MTEKDKKKKKPFKETKVGKFLSKVAPEIIKGVGEFTPFSSAIDTITNAITGSEELTPENKEIALALLEMDKQEMTEVSNRWKYDLESDSWLSKNIRPLVLGYLIFVTSVIIVLDSSNVLTVANNWISLIEGTLSTIIIAYFGSRGIEKTVSHYKK